MLTSSSFFSVLSDGSQVVRNGRPAYLCVGLENIDNYGDASADNIMKSLDDVFLNPQKMNITEEDYLEHLVGATADGAAINTGCYNGVLTKMKRKRPWLIHNHCVSHRLELALKDSLMKHS